MISVMNAVQQVVENSEFAEQGLREGLLNISAYAKTIRHEVETITKKEISNDSSIVMALSRYGKQLKGTPTREVSLQINNIVSRSHLVKITYERTMEIQERFAMLNLLDSVKRAPFFVAMVRSTEVVVIIDASLVDTVRGHFGSFQPLTQLKSLASISIQADIDTIILPRQSSVVLGQLASKGIAAIEYAASTTGLNVIVHESDASAAHHLLHMKFLKR